MSVLPEVEPWLGVMLVMVGVNWLLLSFVMVVRMMVFL
jgi:hypothetical protein